MDQLKIVLAALKKHHFWALCGVAVVTALVGWWLATGSLDKAFADRTKEINSNFQNLQTIIGQDKHPNQQVIEKIGQKTDDLKAEVYQAWERLYKEQKEKNPLPKPLGEDFKTVFESLGPKDEIPGRYLQRYMDFIGYHIPTLFEMADVLRLAPPAEDDKDTATAEPPGRRRPPIGFAGPVYNPEAGMDYDSSVGGSYPYPTGAMGGVQNYGVEMVGIVDWVPTDRDQFVQRFNWPTRPTTDQVRLAQEDLWVYEALLRIIKNANEGATDHHNASVKQIRALQIGRDAAASWQGAADGAYLPGGDGGEYGRTVAGPAPSAAGPTPTTAGTTSSRGSAGTTATPTGTTAGGGYPGTTASGAYGSDGYGYAVMPADYRYVDDAGRPLGPDQEHPYAEFKMMPIRMLLLMNETKIPKLLVECANSNMPVEPRHVALNPGGGARVDLMSRGQTGYDDGASGYPAHSSGASTYRSGPSSYSSGAASYGSGASGYSSSPASYGSGASGYDGGYSSYGTGYSGYGSGYDSGRRGAFMMTPGGGAYGMGGTRGSSEGAQRRNLDLLVEIQGIICIYNPPDAEKLGTGTAGERPAEVTPATPPAASTGPRAAPPAAAGGAPTAGPGAGGQAPTPDG